MHIIDNINMPTFFLATGHSDQGSLDWQVVEC